MCCKCCGVACRTLQLLQYNRLSLQKDKRRGGLNSVADRKQELKFESLS